MPEKMYADVAYHRGPHLAYPPHYCMSLWEGPALWIGSSKSPQVKTTLTLDESGNAAMLRVRSGDSTHMKVANPLEQYITGLFKKH